MSSSPYGNDAHCHSDGLPGDAGTLEAGRDAAFDGGVRRARGFKVFLRRDYTQSPCLEGGGRLIWVFLWTIFRNRFSRCMMLIFG